MREETFLDQLNPTDTITVRVNTNGDVYLETKSLNLDFCLSVFLDGSEAKRLALKIINEQP